VSSQCVRVSESCPQCGATFTPLRSTQRCCGKSCGEKHRTASGRERKRWAAKKALKRADRVAEAARLVAAPPMLALPVAPVPVKRVWPASRLRGCRAFTCGRCVECGESFVMRGVRSTFGYRHCSPRCGKRSERRAYRERRRARVRGGERVYRLAVFERDGWKCQLCGKQVARGEVVPHPLAPTLDHILPVSVGGSHVLANVQTAHFICNSRKGAGAANDQLRLVG
jgi:hypothetical protein